MRSRPRDGIVGVIAEMNDVRAARQLVQLSQREFAAVVGVSVETLRAWDSGRRSIPAAAAAHVRLIAEQYAKAQGRDIPASEFTSRDEHRPTDGPGGDVAAVVADGRLMPLRELALALGISVYTVRAAAREGRLAVTYSTRMVFGRPVPLATRHDGMDYLHRYYGQRSRWIARPPATEPLPSVPTNYDVRLLALRRRLRLTQAQLAVQIGAAGKAVVYQWESQKRRPSPVLWQRIDALERGSTVASSLSRWPRSRYGPV